jgi:hypothetical protein
VVSDGKDRAQRKNRQVFQSRGNILRILVQGRDRDTDELVTWDVSSVHRPVRVDSEPEGGLELAVASYQTITGKGRLDFTATLLSYGQPQVIGSMAFDTKSYRYYEGAVRVYRLLNQVKNHQSYIAGVGFFSSTEGRSWGERPENSVTVGLNNELIEDFQYPDLSGQGFPPPAASAGPARNRVTQSITIGANVDHPVEIFPYSGVGGMFESQFDEVVASNAGTAYLSILTTRERALGTLGVNLPLFYLGLATGGAIANTTGSYSRSSTLIQPQITRTTAVLAQIPPAVLASSTPAPPGVYKRMRRWLAENILAGVSFIASFIEKAVVVQVEQVRIVENSLVSAPLHPGLAKSLTFARDIVSPGPDSFTQTTYRSLRGDEGWCFYRKVVTTVGIGAGVSTSYYLWTPAQEYDVAGSTEFIASITSNFALWSMYFSPGTKISAFVAGEPELIESGSEPDLFVRLNYTIKVFEANLIPGSPATFAEKESLLESVKFSAGELNLQVGESVPLQFSGASFLRTT